MATHLYRAVKKKAVAGILVEDDRVVECAPILRSKMSPDWIAFQVRLERLGWTVEYVREAVGSEVTAAVFLGDLPE